MDSSDLRTSHQQLLNEATRLAGSLTALSQRATTYHHLFRDSGGNHIFPLIAAHGALWARGYFAFGKKLGTLLSWQYAFDPARRQRKLAALEDFANAFRDINRKVCVDTYANYHFVENFGDHPDAASIVEPMLLEALNRVHAARRTGRKLSDNEKREVFETHFLNEQTHVVGPCLQAAVDSFDWPVVRAFAVRPLIRFAYFGMRECFLFRNFACREERIEKGLRAFDIAASAGWNNVESALKNYDILPAEFFANATDYFTELRSSLLTA
jgi:hypothetical protein